MAEHHVPPSLERALEDLQDLHLAPSPVERFVGFWKRHGLRKAIVLLLAVTLPLWRYVWIPHSVSAALATAAEYYGAELEVEDWSSDWGNIRVVGEDVVLHARGAYANQKLFEANAIEFDWSVLRGLTNIFDRAKSLVLFRDMPSEEPVHSIRIERATLHMERLLSGRWNWEDAIEADRVNRSALALFRVPVVDAEQMRLEWVEHLPANSGGGLIEQTTASLLLDDVRLRLTDVVLPDDARANAAGFAIDGRTADGRFSATGRMNVARWGAQSPLANVSTAAISGGSWSPTFDVDLYLENVGAAAFARLVSDASLVPAAGTMTGRIKLARNDAGGMLCRIDLQLRNVQYAPNPRSRYVQARQSEMQRELAQALFNEHVNRECAPDWQDPEFRLAKALQAEITGDAVRNASPIVQGAAGYDRLRFVAVDQNAVDSVTNDLSAKIGEAIGGQRGAAVAQALTRTEIKDTANPVSRGVRSVGGGLKRIFGGGSAPKKNERKK